LERLYFTLNQTIRLPSSHSIPLSRFFIEYKWNASPTLNYDKNLEIIVFDHLAPQDPRAKGAFFAYVPDGTYEGFKWIKGAMAMDRKSIHFCNQRR
jgi:hypothetical protein